MNLIKENWSKKDIDLFQEYLCSYKNTPEKIIWTQKIVNTKKPLLAIPSPKLKEITKEIAKGNYLEFLEYNLNCYHENTIINAYLINKVKDFKIIKKLLLDYLDKVDNWASVDAIKLKVKGNENQFLDLVKKLIKHKKQFFRRCGIIILFNFLNDQYIDEVFKTISLLKNEQEYYVNMALAWLLCESFIKQRDKTLKYLNDNKLNSFVLNKMISKCCNSYRVSNDDKKMLKSLSKNVDE